MDLHADLELARRAAVGGAAVAQSLFGGVLDVQIKGAPGDVVSEADLAAEEHIRALLAQQRPGDGMLGEEGSYAAGQRRWLIDAIDGTANFVRGDPFWCTAVALEDAAGPVVAAVHHAATDQTFSAARGRGCCRNGERLRARADIPLDHAVLATYLHPGDGDTPTFARVLPEVASLRIRGSGTLELAWLVAGRIDAWLQRDVHPWDLVPGALLVRESGRVCESLANADGLWSYAGGAQAAAELRALIGR